MNTTSTQGLSLNAETYERMFSARVSTPDSQLAEYLNTYPHKDKAWYPTYKELATLLFHDDAESIYKDIGSDLPDIPYDRSDQNRPQQPPFEWHLVGLSNS